jgi:hypothetical protein
MPKKARRGRRVFERQVIIAILQRSTVTLNFEIASQTLNIEVILRSWIYIKTLVRY